MALRYVKLIILLLAGASLYAQSDYVFSEVIQIDMDIKPTIAVLPFSVNTQYYDAIQSRVDINTLQERLERRRAELKETKNKSQIRQLQAEISEGEKDYLKKTTDIIIVEDTVEIRKLTAQNIKRLGMFDILPFDDVDKFIEMRSVNLREVYMPAYYTLFDAIDAGFIISADVETTLTNKNKDKSYRVLYTLINVKSGEIWTSDPVYMKADGQGITFGVASLVDSFFERVSLTPEDLIKAVKPPEYNLGDMGPGGGIVFFVKSNHAGGWRYMEASPEDSEPLPWGIGDADGFWQPDAKGTSEKFDEGERNTQMIINMMPPHREGDPMIAAQYCAEFSTIVDGVRYDNWFLPSLNELNMLYLNLKRVNLGNFKDRAYWSSTQSAAHAAWFQTFNNGRVYPNGLKGDKFYVRPIRKF